MKQNKMDSTACYIERALSVQMWNKGRKNYGNWCKCFLGEGVQSFSRFLSRYRGLFSFRSYLWRVCTYIDFSTQPFRLPSHNMFINTLKWKPHQVCLLLPFPFLPLDQLDMLPLFPILKICTFFKNGKIIQIP